MRGMKRDIRANRPTALPVRIVDYAPKHREHFRALDLELITRFFAVEKVDRRMLDDPEREIIRSGAEVSAVGW
jgi:hypothetical protein